MSPDRRARSARRLALIACLLAVVGIVLSTGTAPAAHPGNGATQLCDAPCRGGETQGLAVADEGCIAHSGCIACAAVPAGVRLAVRGHVAAAPTDGRAWTGRTPPLPDRPPKPSLDG